MKLEIGKRYITKSGAITAPLEPFGCGATSGWPFIDRVAGMTYRSDGRYWKNCADDELDLVAEYFEPAPANPESRIVDLRSSDSAEFDDYDHDEAAEELLHSRIADLEQKNDECRKSYNKYMRDSITAMRGLDEAKERIAQLESQLANSEHERAKLERMRLVDPEPLQSRIASLEQQLDETRRLMISDNGAAQMRIAELEATLRHVASAGWDGPRSGFDRSVISKALPVDDEPFVLRYASISSWLHKLPDGYRELALANYASSSNTSPRHCVDAVSALWAAFSWRDSPEGFDFWQRVSHYLNCAHPLPAIPTNNA